MGKIGDISTKQEKWSLRPNFMNPPHFMMGWPLLPLQRSNCRQVGENGVTSIPRANLLSKQNLTVQAALAMAWLRLWPDRIGRSLTRPARRSLSAKASATSRNCQTTLPNTYLATTKRTPRRLRHSLRTAQLFTPRNTLVKTARLCPKTRIQIIR